MSSLILTMIPCFRFEYMNYRVNNNTDELLYSFSGRKDCKIFLFISPLSLRVFIIYKTFISKCTSLEIYRIDAKVPVDFFFFSMFQGSIETKYHYSTLYTPLLSMTYSHLLGKYTIPLSEFLRQR